MSNKEEYYSKNTRKYQCDRIKVLNKAWQAEGKSCLFFMEMNEAGDQQIVCLASLSKGDQKQELKLHLLKCANTESRGTVLNPDNFVEELVRCGNATWTLTMKPEFYDKPVTLACHPNDPGRFYATISYFPPTSPTMRLMCFSIFKNSFFLTIRVFGLVTNNNKSTLAGYDIDSNVIAYKKCRSILNTMSDT